MLWLAWGMKRDGGNHNALTERLATKRTQEMAQLLQTQFGYFQGQLLFVHQGPIGGHDEAAWKYRFGLVLIAFVPIKQR